VISDALDIVCDLTEVGLILVVDDNVQHLESIKKQISDNNMLKRTHFFTNGNEVV
jgi:CheY-like chemotaxis protein